MNREDGVASSGPREGKIPVLVAGDGVIAAEITGHQFEAQPAARLRPKVLGRHRFVATVAYVLSEEMAVGALDPSTTSYLDNENLMYLAIGCWDCEQVLGPGGVTPGSVCPAAGDYQMEG